MPSSSSVSRNAARSTEASVCSTIPPGNAHSVRCCPPVAERRIITTHGSVFRNVNRTVTAALLGSPRNASGPSWTGDSPRVLPEEATDSLSRAYIM